MALRDVKALVTITTNATKAIEDGKKLKQTYAEINAQLNDMRARKKTNSPEFKELQKLAEDTKARINEMKRGMELVEKVMRNLSGTTGKDLNRGLRETSKEFNKTSADTDKGRQKLERLRQSVAALKKELSDRRGLTMSFQDAQKQLGNLNKVSLDNLNKGLAAIKEKLAQPLPGKWRQQLEQMQAQYQAAITVRQAPVTNRPVTKMNAAQLKQEQAAITSALAATAGVKGYEQQAANYKKRLQEITQELKNMSTAEKQAEERAKQLQATQQAAKTVQAVYRGQQVSLEQLNQAYATLEARAKQFAGVNPAKMQAAQRQMAMLRQRIGEVNGTILSQDEINRRVNNSGKYSVDQLRQAYNQLQTKLNSLHTNERTAIKATQMQMKQLERQINSATGQVSGFAKAWQTAKQNIMMYVGVFAIVNKIRASISALVNKNKELSDSMANIRKVSQWASADVVKLTENMAKIDTRNTLATLQNLAYQGAKLGIGQYGVEGLTGFVRAAEQVQTALGEDLGEEALPALAKLTEVMGLIPKFGVEQAMQKAGSAIYQLGATSTATGANIVEFSKRLMGLANVSGVSADQLLGLGAAADTMALMPEVAATAFNKLFNSIHGNTEGIAKAVGLAKEELTSLLYEGRTMDALVKVFERMQTMSMAEMEGRGVFKELGSDGARLTNVMITMANKVDMLKKSLQTSNEAFSEGRAVINEYMIQQETAAAYFERASNIWEKAFINPEGVDIVKQLAQEWYNVSYEMTHSASTMASIKNTLELLAGTVKLLITYLPTLVQLMMAYGVGAALQSIVLQYRAIKLAALEAGGAAAKFNALMKTNAIALAITGVLMLIMKLKDLKAAEEEVAAAEERRNTIMADTKAEALQVYNEQKKALDKYYDALKDTNASEEERNDIIRQFKSEFGSYLEKLGIEINTYKDMEDALHRVNKELKDKAFYETGQKLRESYVGDAKQTQTNALSQYMQAAQKYNLPTKLMEDIVEGNVKTVDEAMQRVQQELNKGANGGTLTLNGNRFGVGGWQDVRTEESKTVGDRVKDFLFGNKTPKADQQTTDIYHAINNLVTATQEVNSRENQVTKFLDQYADKYSPNISVDGAILNLKRLKELNEDKLNEGLNVLRDEWKKMSETDRKSERGVQIGGAIDQYSKQIRSLRGEGYTPPPTAKEIRAQKAEERKRENEAKQALRKDLQDAQRESDAIIAKIEEWYRLQETVITDMQNDGKLTKEQAEQAVRTLNIAKNTALRDARLAVSGRDTKAWETTKQQIGNLMLDQGQWSQELLQQILGVSMESIRKNLSRIDKGGGKYGITTSSLKDAVDKNAAGNQREIARLQARSQQEVEKILMEYDYIDQAMRAFSDRLAQMGILTETARQMAERLSEANDVNALFSMRDYDKLLASNESAKRDMLQAFIATGSTPYAVNPDDTDQLRSWFMDFVGQFATVPGASPLGEGMPNVEYQYQSWAEPFQADFELWLRNSEQYKAQIQAFYFSLMKSEQNYYENRKKQREQDQREADTRWQAYGWTAQQEQENMQYERDASLRKIHGEGQNFGQTYGFADTIADDPEIKRIQNRMEWRQREMDDLVAKNASEEVIMQKQNEMLQEAANLAEKVSQEVANRIAKVQTLSEPLNAFGEEVGQKLGEMWQGISQEGKLTFGEMARNMGIEYAKLTIKMVSENLQKKLQQGIFYKQMEMQAMQHQVQLYNIQQAGAAARATGQLTAGATLQGIQAAQNAAEIGAEGGKATVMTMFGISSGAAKTIAQLGYWGIPLIGVIASILLGLLNSAKATASQSTESAASSSSAPKMKVVSGMLTYDEGNADRVVSNPHRKLYDDGSVQVYDGSAAKSSPSGDRRGVYPGTDGHVYRATPQPALPDGVQLIRKPIATTVNGQPSLVAERGPEIIIGRRATRHIQMNEPGLLHHLAAINGRYRTYDQGTVPAGLAGIAQQFPAPQGEGSGVGSASSSEQNARVAAALEQNTQMMLAMQQTIAALSQTVTTLQQRGIPAHIQKYGTGGLIDEVKSGLKFDQRYNR